MHEKTSSKNHVLFVGETKSAEEDTSSRKNRQLKHERQAEHKTTNLLLFLIIMLSYHVSNMLLLFIFLKKNYPHTHTSDNKKITNELEKENLSDMNL